MHRQKNKKKSVMLFIDGLGSGGAQKQIVTLASSLKSFGLEVTVAYYHDEAFFKEYLDSRCIKRFKVPRGASFFEKIIFPFRLSMAIRSKKINTVISFLDGPNFYMELARVCSFFSFNLIVSERFMTIGKRSFSQIILAKFHRVANVITTNSYHQKHRMILDEPWMHDRLYTIYNGYERPAYRKLLEKHSSSLPRPVKLLVVSSVASKKNPINLIHALHLLKKRGYSFHLRWAGSKVTSLEKDTVYNDCISLLLKYNLRSDFEFLDEVSEISKEYLNADWLVHPSFYEGLPNAICESIAHGLPVVASDVCDHKALVFESSCGLLFDPYSIDSIADSLEKAVNVSFELYSHYHKACFKFFDDNLEVNKFAKNYEKLIDEL